jgi:hypothetical protein
MNIKSLLFVKKYRARGAYYGGLLGFLLSGLIAATKIKESSFSLIDFSALVSGGTTVMMLAGYIYIELIIHGLFGGSSITSSDSSESDGFYGDDSGCGDSDGGDGGGE